MNNLKITMTRNDATMTICNIRQYRDEIEYDVKVTGRQSWKSHDCPYSSLVDLLANLQQGGWIFVNA